jgi:gliding motility-associated-like protein
MIQSLANNISTYTYTGYAAGDNLCFTVHALHTGGTPVSVSNNLCINAAAVQVSTFNFITNVSVLNKNEVTINYMNDTTAVLNFIHMQRSSPDTSNFQALNSIAVVGSLPQFDTYVDSTAKTDDKSYWYNILAIDNCNTNYISLYGRSIHLTGIIDGAMQSELTWNPFSLGYSTVQNYIIHRVTDTGSSIAATLPSSATSFNDDLNPMLGQSNSFCYMIEAVHDVALPNGYTGTFSSYSNQICLQLPARAYVPNAFVPDGKNNILKPYIAFSDANNYTFQVYDRWGKMIFESHDVNVGWNGTYNGKDQPAGAYAYHLQFTGDDGKKIIRSGTVVLIR